MLTLILETQEGQQFELNVQPEDTFADLKRQYSHTDGLFESLVQFITNGISVEENTKIFNYVSSSAHEWFSTEPEALPPQFLKMETIIKECCAQGCSNSEVTTPGKLFFPLPTDHNRLLACLTEIGRLDLLSQVSKMDEENHQNYSLCSNHFEITSLPPLSIEERPITLSLLKSGNERIQAGSNNGLVSKLQESECQSENSVLNSLETLDFEHPGILCRLCGETTANPINIFDTREDKSEGSLAEKINLCLPITVTVMDPLPKQICQDCQKKLNTCHELALSSLKTEDKLILFLRENKLFSNSNSERQCPLCLEGRMKTVKKSGIYHKEDLKNDLNLSINVNHTRNSTVIEERSKNRISEPSVSDYSLLPVPVGEFSCSVCTEKLVNVTAIESHKCSPESCASTYSCVICTNTNFTYPRELDVHYRRHGIIKNTFVCQLCNYSCEELSKAAEHVKICGKIFPNTTNSKSIQDHNCCDTALNYLAQEVDFHSQLEMQENLPKKKQQTRYDCHFCQKKFARKGSLQKHISVAHSESIENPTIPKCYKCRSCNEAFAHETDVKSHINVCHLGPYVSSDLHSAGHEFAMDELTIANLYTCEYCERCFTMPSSLHDHRDIEHDKKTRYSCPICLEVFDSHKQLAAHKSFRSHHKSLDNLMIKQLYVCKYCDKTFLHHSSLATHELQHQEITPYLCRPCNLNFETYGEVASHRDIVHPYQSELHEGSSRSYKCQYCEKLFAHEFVLIKHMRMHTGERPHKCTICGKGFSQSSGLYTHMKIHSDDRPYGCPKCPRTYKIKGDRDNHVKRHSGIRPYKCEFCSKAFMTQHVYSQHRRIHTNERPYKCDICGEAFRRSYVRTVHMRIHTGEKPHLCDLCPKTYRQRGDLQKHRKIQHGISANANSEIASLTKREDSYDSCSKLNEKMIEGKGSNSLLLTL